MDAEAVMQLRMGLGWVFLIRGDAVWIVLAYRLDSIVSDGSYSIIWILLGKTGFYALAGYWLDRTNGLDGTLMGRGWDRLSLAGTGTGAPPLALEGLQAVGSGGWHQLRRCCKGADNLCWSRKIIQIGCKQIRTNT